MMVRDLTHQALTLPVRKTPVYSQVEFAVDEYRMLAIGPGQTFVVLTAISLIEEVLDSGRGQSTEQQCEDYRALTTNL